MKLTVRQRNVRDSARRYHAATGDHTLWSFSLWQVTTTPCVKPHHSHCHDRVVAGITCR